MTILVVHGATGLQGGSIVRGLAGGKYEIRAIVRDPIAPKALELTKLPGVSLAHVPDLLDTESLKKAYTGADVVYGCTFTTPDEEAHGRAMGDAVLTAGVPYMVWSTLYNVEEATGGEIKIPNFDIKARVSDYYKARGVPAVHMLLGGFMQNLVLFPHALKRGENGNIEFRFLPGIGLDIELPLVHIRKDLPNAVRLFIENKDLFLGKEVVLSPTQMTLAQQAVAIQSVIGIETVVLPVPFLPGLPQERTDLAKFIGEKKYKKFKGLPLHDPLLAQVGFIPASFEDFVKEELVPYLKL